MGYPSSPRRSEENRYLRGFALQLAPGDGELRRPYAYLLSPLAQSEAKGSQGLCAVPLSASKQDRVRFGDPSKLGRDSETESFRRRRRSGGGAPSADLSQHPVRSRAFGLRPAHPHP